MAGYKVPQDVEAEDKFLGPLTFKQFLFAGGAAISGYILFIFATKSIWIGVALLLPVFAFFAILAFPWSKDQPTEIWLAARIRFFLVPRRRIWDQTGIKDLVEVTVPKREEKVYSDGLSHDQVYSRVNALASVVDTRGWAVKNIAAYTDEEQSDRLVTATERTPDENDQILASTVDVMDDHYAIADQFSTLIQQSEQKHKQDTLNMIEQARHATAQQKTDDDIPLPTVAEAHESKKKHGDKEKRVNPQDLWFLNEPEKPRDPNLASFQNNTVVGPGTKEAPTMGMGIPQPAIKEEDEAKLLEKVHSKQAQEAAMKQHTHLKTIQPLSAVQDDGQSSSQAQDDPASDKAISDPAGTSTTPVDPAILALSGNDDLNVETLARQAKKDMPDEGEVVISLH
ncbi:PrgI family protein [Candidatus Saccharibacteria bacterium]|nr:PrgI family protein [Candidatus Saccharibacteria bacterium]